jgi:hypothetical protein
MPACSAGAAAGSASRLMRVSGERFKRLRLGRLSLHALLVSRTLQRAVRKNLLEENAVSSLK